MVRVVLPTETGAWTNWVGQADETQKLKIKIVLLAG